MKLHVSSYKVCRLGFEPLAACQVAEPAPLYHMGFPLMHRAKLSSVWGICSTEKLENGLVGTSLFRAPPHVGSQQKQDPASAASGLRRELLELAQELSTTLCWPPVPASALGHQPSWGVLRAPRKAQQWLGA